MSYLGSRVQLSITDSVATLTFNNENESVNKFDRGTLEDLRAATDALKSTEGLTGLMVTSGKKRLYRRR
jgi:3-hydroxyacyl-CoA dehydrogenase/enoyl-CoA hydratase/3-hydroxybutyryl-CoA epimerase/enoyl-CoA isomerase